MACLLLWVITCVSWANSKDLCKTSTEITLIDDRGDEHLTHSTNDSLDAYIRDLKQYPVLPKKKIVELFQEWEQTKSKEAYDTIVNHNLRLAFFIAKKYNQPEDPLLDLIQAGNMGLMKAVTKFEYRRGYQFSTYATIWIHQSIKKFIKDQSRTIRIPVDMIVSMNKMENIQREFYKEFGRPPSDEEVMAEMGITSKQLKKIQRVPSQSIPIDTSTSPDEKDRHLRLGGARIEDNNINSPEDNIIALEQSEQIKSVLSTLTPRERIVLKMHFGIEGEEHTYTEIGRHLSLTKQRIYEIMAKILQKLRDHPQIEILRYYL